MRFLLLEYHMYIHCMTAYMLCVYMICRGCGSLDVASSAWAVSHMRRQKQERSQCGAETQRRMNVCKCMYMYMHCLYYVQTYMFLLALSCPGGKDSRCETGPSLAGAHVGTTVPPSRRRRRLARRFKLRRTCFLGPVVPSAALHAGCHSDGVSARLR